MISEVMKGNVKDNCLEEQKRKKEITSLFLVHHMHVKGRTYICLCLLSHYDKIYFESEQM